MDLIFKVSRMPNIGESIDATSLFVLPGGKGANIAIAACRGCRNKPSTPKRHEGDETTSTNPNGTNHIRVCMNGAVGDDWFGAKLKAKLEQDGVDISGLLTIKGESSGVCTVLAEESSADNRLIAYQGINTRWEPRDPSSVECLAAGARPDLVIAHLGIPQEKVVRVLKAASEDGIDTLLNPSPPEPVASIVYEYVTHLIINKPETALLSGCNVEALDTLSAWEDAAQYFLSRGVKNVVITLGDRGAYYVTHSGKRGIVSAENDVNVVDVTGAGFGSPLQSKLTRG